jgi:ketosteroid isomerase-like protein
MGIDRAHVDSWVAGYEAAWRTAGTEGLGALFTPDATYSLSPWREPPVAGLDALAAMWEDGRDGPDEPFTMEHEIVAVEGDTAVVRLAVEYGGTPGGRWRDLWVLRFAADGRCMAFEEWPFAPGQKDGH